ncbi:MAG TPA: TetR/AcrR family transcriptional regulator [Alphaproteobacteria bacterium]|jgi:AcrR family transcriptional regulator|nr:TetR/AcrR family transcriptional regulator [Alphaproteobacteria bacterium]
MTNVPLKKSYSGGRPSRDAVEELDARLIACASRLFMERGYAGTSIEAVAAEAGAGKNTIYRRYPTKADLFQAVVDEQIRTLLRAPDSVAEGDLESGLRQLAVTLLQAALNPETTAFQRLVIAEAERFPEIAAICLDRAFRPAIAMARAVLSNDRRASAENLDEAAEQFVAAVVYGPHLHALMGHRLFETHAEIERHAEGAVSLFVRGLGHR